MVSALQVSDLRKAFGGLRAVNSLTFMLAENEVLGLIGPNGSGKSTALSMVMGVIRADGGRVRLYNEDITNLPLHEVSRRGVAMVFQHSRPVNRQTVLENIEIALLPHNIHRLFLRQDEVHQRAYEAAKRLGLERDALRYPPELPFASLRRLEIARCVARQPRVLLLDEPFAGLAPGEVVEFVGIIESLRAAGCSILVVDHNVKTMARLVDRVVVMSAGVKIADGFPDQVLKEPGVRVAYFGSPVEPRPVPAESGPEQGQTRRLLDVDIRSVRYGQAEVLRNVDLNMRVGEFVSIVGINGAGKSTLFKSILGLVSCVGSISWEGSPIGSLKPSARATLGIALCPETRELFGRMSVVENLVLGGHGLRGVELRKQVARVYRLFPRLRDRQHQPAHTLSGGERQMLTIARALMQRPKLLILDEPTLGLAPNVIQDIGEALIQLRVAGLTVLLGEQNLTFALRHAGRILVLENGAIAWRGDTARFVEEVGDSIL